MTARPEKAKVRGKRAVTSTARKPAEAKVQAKRPVFKNAPRREASGLRKPDKRLAEALQQQAATDEILRVMASSPGDMQPVLYAVAERAARLCDALFAQVLLVEGDVLLPTAAYWADARLRVRHDHPGEAKRPLALKRSVISGRASLDCVTIHHADAVPLIDTEYPDVRAKQRELGWRAVLAVPLLHKGGSRGVIFMFRSEPRPFSPEQIALVETFARQAAIAIDNARLFKETKEALEQQTATSEILRVISRSPTDVQPVFDAIVQNAARLCGADFSCAARFDGELLYPLAYHSFSPGAREIMERSFPMPPNPGLVLGRAAMTRMIVNVADTLADPEYSRDIALAGGWRSALGIPMLRDGNLIGAIAVSRRDTGAFPDHLVALVQTFADQAVIAIENVRLFTELTHKNHALTQAHAQVTEALARQTATSEILRIISSSPTDVRPVFETIVANAARVCSAESAAVYRFDGDVADFVAGYNFSPEAREAYRHYFPCPLRETDHLQRIVDGSVLNIPDIESDHHTTGRTANMYRARGVRSTIFVPMLREDQAIGAIGVSHREVGAFSAERVELLKTFADQAVIAIENVRLFDEVQARTHELAESLKQQTGTADVLKVISRSAFDLQTVLDNLTESACKLCEAETSGIYRPDGDVFKLAAMFGQSAEVKTALKQHTIRPGRDTCAGRALLERGTVHIPDTELDPEYKTPTVLHNVRGNRAMLGVPMLRERSPIGVFILTRPIARPFTEKQIALAATFADQAGIAIENVRLFNETKEALQRQTATSEILSVISQSPTDVQPVFDTIAAAAMKLCGANRAHVFISDGKLLHIGAFASTSPGPDDEMRQLFPRRLGNDLTASRAILTGGVVVIQDVLNDPEYALKELAPAGGFRSVLAVPLLREGSPIGAIAVSRPEPGPFPDNQIALLQTFAAQAVIAIENVRLFNETKDALERQTATSDILRVISQSPRDVQPVFDTIVGAAVRLCSASNAAVLTFDGELMRLAALANVGPDEAEAVRLRYPMPPGRQTAGSRAIQTGSTVVVPDVLEDPEFDVRARSFRSVVSVPLMREGRPIGAITVGRPEPGQFPEKQITLLQTFADQAVIAIENVRLFTELEIRTRDLTRSVQELRALGEVGQAVSSTLDLETVLSTIVSRATSLAGVDGGSIWEYDEAREEFYVHATDRLPKELVEAQRAAPIRKGEGALGRLAVAAEPVVIRDIVAEENYQSHLREVLIRCGYRSLLAVPLLRQDHLLGALAVSRNRPSDFSQEVIALLKTFATQSALAIQNARLFREIEVKSCELEAASRHKSEFLANMSHELRTPLNAIIGFSEVLSERLFGEINEKQAEYVSDILQSGQHLLSLINDILDLSKIEAGRMELEFSDFNLPSTIEQTVTLIRERAVRRGITVGRTIDHRLGSIHADERKVKQVLLNLLSNALKFTPEGGKIDVRAAVSDGVAEISVTDTGIGISPEDQEAVFEEFRQVGTASKKVEGTGLGLAISRKFIELHGGKIWVTSQVGTGSTFAFTLPLR